jgi:hypothetical protein
MIIFLSRVGWRTRDLDVDPVYINRYGNRSKNERRRELQWNMKGTVKMELVEIFVLRIQQQSYIAAKTQPAYGRIDLDR